MQTANSSAKQITKILIRLAYILVFYRSITAAAGCFYSHPPCQEREQKGRYRGGEQGCEQNASHVERRRLGFEDAQQMCCDCGEDSEDENGGRLSGPPSDGDYTVQICQGRPQQTQGDDLCAHSRTAADIGGEAYRE